jgi:hypothetical protein
MDRATSIVSKPLAAPFIESLTNTFFAVSAKDRVPFTNPFEGAREISLPVQGQDQAGLQVFAGSGANVESFYDETSGCCAYRWGIAAHPDVARSQLLKWIIDTVNSADNSLLRQVVGAFVILIDDRRNQRVRIVSDVLGMRPWHVGQQDGRLVCGSDVWLLQQAGFDMGGVNYDAVAGWLRLLFDCTEKGLFNGFPPIGHGVVATWEGGNYSESPYSQIKGGQEKPPLEQVIEGAHERVSRTFEALTRDLDAVSIALSGGYDSRYIAAMAAERKHLKIESFCVCDRESEAIGAQQVAEVLGIPLQLLRTDGSTWNMYAQPFTFTPAGFPMTRQVSYVAASQRPGVVGLSGFFGDPIVRGSLDRLDKKLEHEITEDLADFYRQSFLPSHKVARFDLLDPTLLKRSDERINAVLRRRFDQCMHTGHPILWVSLFAQQRHYMSSNILQHLHVAEAVSPFVNWESIQFKMQHDATCFSYDSYKKLLDRFFPQLSHIPHNSTLGAKNVRPSNPSRCTTQWARAVLSGLANPKCLPPLSRRKAIPRLIGAAMGRRDVEVVAMFLYRLFLLDQRLRKAGIEFDWNQI